jgi:hypothetical protein
MRRIRVTHDRLYPEERKRTRASGIKKGVIGQFKKHGKIKINDREK